MNNYPFCWFLIFCFSICFRQLCLITCLATGQQKLLWPAKPGQFRAPPMGRGCLYGPAAGRRLAGKYERRFFGSHQKRGIWAILTYSHLNENRILVNAGSVLRNLLKMTFPIHPPSEKPKIYPDLQRPPPGGLPPFVSVNELTVISAEKNLLDTCWTPVGHLRQQLLHIYWTPFKRPLPSESSIQDGFPGSVISRLSLCNT